MHEAASPRTASPGGYAGEGALSRFGRPALRTLRDPTTQQRRFPSQSALATNAHWIKCTTKQTPAQSQQCSPCASQWLIWRSIVISKPPRTTLTKKKKAERPRVAKPVIPASGCSRHWNVRTVDRHGGMATYVSRDDVHIQLQSIDWLATWRTCREAACWWTRIRPQGTQHRPYLARRLAPPRN